MRIIDVYQCRAVWRVLESFYRMRQSDLFVRFTLKTSKGEVNE